MKRQLIFDILLVLMAFLACVPDMQAQDGGKRKRKKAEEYQIVPGVQWDTAVVVRPVKYPEHLIGVRYSFDFTGVSMTPDMEIKGYNSPVNIALLYTYYHPLWSTIDIFGLQTGVKYGKYGFRNGKYEYENFEQVVTYIEVPFVSAFHVDLGEYFRILASLGMFGGYRMATTKENGFDCFDIRYDYGAMGGLGVALRWGRMEFHIEGSFQYSLAFLYHPEKMSSDWWLYSYPWRAGINFGVHVRLK